MLLSKSVEIRQSETASRPTIRQSRISVFTQPRWKAAICSSRLNDAKCADFVEKKSVERRSRCVAAQQGAGRLAVAEALSLVAYGSEVFRSFHPTQSLAIRRLEVAG